MFIYTQEDIDNSRIWVSKDSGIPSSIRNQSFPLSPFLNPTEST